MTQSMKAAILCVLLAGATLSGCEHHRDGKRCIGVGDEADPGVKYEASVRNIIVGAIFIETIFIPIIVLLKEIRCPLPASNASAAQPPPSSPKENP